MSLCIRAERSRNAIVGVAIRKIRGEKLWSESRLHTLHDRLGLNLFIGIEAHRVKSVNRVLGRKLALTPRSWSFYRPAESIYFHGRLPAWSKRFERLRVESEHEKPPIAMVEKAWLIASKAVIPATL